MRGLRDHSGTGIDGLWPKDCLCARRHWNQDRILGQAIEPPATPRLQHSGSRLNRFCARAGHMCHLGVFHLSCGFLYELGSSSAQ
jgi:hypothetical protein